MMSRNRDDSDSNFLRLCGRNNENVHLIGTLLHLPYSWTKR